jgi:sensor histidine kinase YesM
MGIRTANIGVWNQPRPRSARDFLLVLAKRSAWGILIYSVISAAVWLTGYAPSYSGIGEYLRAAFSIGSIFSISFYFTCAFPWYFLGPLIHTYPSSVRYPITAVTGAVGACLGLTISMEICSRIPGFEFVPPPRLHSLLGGEAVAGAVLAIIIGAFRKLQEEVRRAEAMAHEKEMRESLLAEAAAKAQAAALQAQINPHFFFNTLNTLSSLIPADPEAAQEIVGRLADMFRYTLACARAESVTLAQELEFTENYLHLEQARFRERLRVSMPEGEFGDIRLPGLSLQPLVENAIKHGVSQRVEGGDVRVAVRRNGTCCSIDVSSPASGPSESGPFFRDGHALENVRDRLKLFAGDQANVDIGREGPARVRVSLVLPK